MKWISILDKLPDDDEAVLMCDWEQDRRLPFLGWYEDGKDKSYPSGFYSPNLESRLVVSHWIPIPPIPEFSKEKS